MEDEMLIEDDELELLEGEEKPDGDQELYEHLRIEVDRGQVPLRIDKYLTEHTQHSSRNRIQQAADAGFIHVNGKPVKSNYKVRPNDVITLMLDRPKHDTSIVAEDIPLNVVYEDDDLMVVNKEAGMVVHPGAGNFTGTLINAVAYHLKDLESFDANDPEVGLVHRIDKDTSGLLVVAKNDFAHQSLARQIKAHSFTREYEAVVYGNLKQDEGTVDAPIGRHPTHRKKMAVTDKHSRHAVTHYEVIERYNGFTHVRLHLETGRTHQIRVHMAYIGHPVAGDAVYGPKKVITALEGQCLHARLLGFDHPRSGRYVEVESELPPYFEAFLKKLNK